MTLTVAAFGALTAPPALAVDVRPSGFLERGRYMQTDEGLKFVPDSESALYGGRYFRLSGSDVAVFYGFGHPSVDWAWPTYKINRGVFEIINASPGGLNFLERYQDYSEYTQGFARVGWMILAGGTAALIGGLGYNLLPGNAREMQPIWFGVSGGVAAAGLLFWGGANLSAVTNESLLDQSIDAYNREMSGRRRRSPLYQPPAFVQ